jgi:CRP/FNR family transcriptional regulator
MSTQDIIEEFFSTYPKQVYKKNDIIIHPDTNSSYAYYIKKGHVRQYSVSADGAELILHLFAPQSFFPMTWVLADIPNRYYYEAIDEVEVYKVNHNELIRFLEKEPKALMSLTKRLLRGLDKLLVRIEGIALSSAHHRLVSAIIFFAHHFGTEEDGKVVINHKFSHRELAALAGITRETVSREFEKLQKSNAVTYKSQSIVILDMEKLRSLIS